VEAWADFYQAASHEIASAAGIQVVRTSTTAITVVSQVDTLAFNRLIGLGFSEPITEEAIDRAISIYREANVHRFFVPVCPDVLTSETERLLQRKGLKHYNNWVKFCRDFTRMPPVKTTLTVREISKAEAAEFAKILVAGFEWSDSLCPWIERSVGRPGWRHYMAYDGDRPVATAALFVFGDMGWIDFAATLPEARGRGAQAVLLKHRMADAGQAGCKWMVVETAEETPKSSAPSFRNVRRYGFQIAYVRPNYIWQRDPAR
jgi:ribosomal protein S18 acetylase RimI-like enzyme